MKTPPLQPGDSVFSSTLARFLMVTIPEEHPMMQFVLRFLLIYHLSAPNERSQKAQEFATAIAARERILLTALRGLLAEPYGCSLCDSGKPRNPAKGHQPDCPYEIARAAIESSQIV